MPKDLAIELAVGYADEHGFEWDECVDATYHSRPRDVWRVSLLLKYDRKRHELELVDLDEHSRKRGVDVSRCFDAMVKHRPGTLRVFRVNCPARVVELDYVDHNA